MENSILSTILAIVLVCLQTEVQSQASYENRTTYVVALLGQRIQNETFNDDIQYDLVLTGGGDGDAVVNISGVEGEISIMNVPANSVVPVTYNETRALNGSEYSNKTLIIDAEIPFSLQVFARANDYVEGFLGIPIQSMNRSDTPFKAYDYWVSTFCDTGGYCQIAVAALEDDTAVSIEVPKHVEDVVFCIGKTFFHTATTTMVTLKQYDSFQIETTSDLSGTHIFSFKPISVFAGSRSIVAENVIAHTMEQLFPTWLWGTEHVVSTLGDNGYGDILKITGSHYNVNVLMSGFHPFILKDPNQAVSRRLDKGTISHIKASTPLQVIQISGLKYASNDTNEMTTLSMTVVPSVQNIQPSTTMNHCVDQVQVLTHNESAGVDVKYSKYRIETVSGTLSCTDCYGLTIMKCNDTATMPASYFFNTSIVGTEKLMPAPITEGTCYDGGRSTVTFDPSALVASPTKIELTEHPGHILKLRIKFCGEAVLQFFTSSNDLSESMMVRITYNQITVSTCPDSPSCETKTIKDNADINNGDALNCTVDMAFFWFWQNQSLTDICMGFGHKVDVESQCGDKFDTSGTFTHVNVMGLFADASFNWDFEHPDGCGLYEERWRCFDRLSNCSMYGTNFCSDDRYAVFASSYCSKYCAKCSSDSYGRKFLVRTPTPLILKKRGLLVSALNSNTGVAVIKFGQTATNIPVEQLDKYTRYFNCSESTLIVHNTYVIITDDEVSVSVLYTYEDDDKMMSYPVFPVDTYGFEYMILDNAQWTDNSGPSGKKICQFTSEYSGIEVIAYADVNQIQHDNVYENSRKYSIDLTKNFITTDLQPYSGTEFNFNKPVGVYCGTFSRQSSTSVYDSYNQMLPTNTWSTEYYVPAFASLSSTSTLDAVIFVIANTDNIIVNISGGFDGTYPIYNRGDVIQISIDGSSSYKITATEKVAVAILFHNADNSSTSFLHIPPVTDMHDVNVQSIPNSFMTTFGYSNIDIRTFFVVDESNGNHEELDTQDMDDFFRYFSVNKTKYGFSVVADSANGKWFVMSSPRNVITKLDLHQTCEIATDKVGDNIDGDCDKLVDEEDCVHSEYGVYRQDTDLDGAFGEDCRISIKGNHVVVKPIDPVCFIIDRPTDQCWTSCQCKCSWVQKYEATKNLTVEELANILADENAQIQKKMKVDTVALSATTAQKISKGDERQSAASIGYVGIAMFCIVFGAIFILDIGSLIRDARILMANLNDGFDRVFGC